MVSSTSLPPEFNRFAVTTVNQGDCLVSDDTDVTFSMVLGSCISACVRDRRAKLGGMNHFLLAGPSGVMRDRYGASARYGAFAMEQLINAVLAQGSGSKKNLEIKVFGGGLINAALTDVGAKNVEFVREFLANEGYAAMAEDLGGSFARRVLFKPHSGRAFVKRLDSKQGESLVREELAIARRPRSTAGRGAEIELF
jgi:chemotaxis protein CheD